MNREPCDVIVRLHFPIEFFTLLSTGSQQLTPYGRNAIDFYILYAAEKHTLYL